MESIVEALKPKILFEIYNAISNNEAAVSELEDECKTISINQNYSEIGVIPSVQNLIIISNLIEVLENARIINHQLFDKDLQFQKISEIFSHFSSTIQQSIIDALNDIQHLDILSEIAIDKKYDVEITKLLRGQLSAYLSMKSTDTAKAEPSPEEKMKQLPTELDNNTFRKIVERTIEAGFFDANFNLINGTTQPQLAYWINCVNEKLSLLKFDLADGKKRNNWKLYTELFDITSQKLAGANQRNTYNGSVKKQDEIDKIFDS